MDQATLNLIMELHRQDIETILQDDVMQGHDGPSEDIDFALSLFKDELKDLELLLADKHMAQSMGLANLRDGIAIAAARSSEQQALND